MTTGQSAIGISDIPFMYSLVTILYISLTGDIENVGRFVIVGLIAGTLGTFFVFWHPVQWIIDWQLIMERKSEWNYLIKLDGYNPPEYKVQLDKWLRLSLKTSAIKYLKDKLTGQIYFLIILITLVVAFPYLNLPEEFQSKIPFGDSLIQIMLFFLFGGMIYFTIRQIGEFKKNLKIQSLYFLFYKEKFVGDESIVKSAIDLGDWVTAKEYADEILGKNWDDLKKYST